MKKLIKGSKAAKDFMAKIRAKRKSKTAPKKAAVKKISGNKYPKPHGYQVKRSVLSGLNKPYLRVSFVFYGHYKIESVYYNRKITCITTNMQAVDNYQSEDGNKRIAKGYKSLRNEVIRKNKK